MSIALQERVCVLAQEREDLHCLLMNAKRRFASGEAPTDAIEAQWFQTLRHEKTIQKLSEEKREIQRILAEGKKSFCEPRPNAYIPDDLGIPRPFGLGVFKPTPAGATMRHIRKAILPDIVI